MDSNIPREAVELLVQDMFKALRLSHASEAIVTARNRVNLFQMMYLQEGETAVRELAGRKRLVLKSEDNAILVCDEYYPEDNGRVHVLNLNLFGTFSERMMRLEVRKVAIDIADVLYCGDDWPNDIGEISIDAVTAYFS